MSGWDIGRVFSAQEVKLDRDEERDGYEEDFTVSRARAAYRGFIRNYREQNLYIYREQLLQNYSKGDTTLTVDLQHLSQYQPRLADALVTRPNEFIGAFEDAAKEALTMSIAATEADEEVPSIQIILDAPSLPKTDIRAIAASHVNRLVCVPGIAISATKTRPKAVQINIKCTTCGLVKRLPCSPAFGAVQIPRRCEGLSRNDNPTGNPVPADVECGVDPYVIVPDQCAYVDQQTLKLQEVPDSIPTGEMPRHVIVSVERGLADRVSPGTRVSVIGVVSVFTSAKGQAGGGIAVRTPYVRAVGLMVHDEGSGRAQDQFTPEEEEAFKTMARDPAVYEKMWKSVAPSISGSYTDDIKKAITCLLMGGSRKRLPDGMRLRGDINVLLLGDPSTAKSQFLKFVERAAPIGVYTSGKGSSAAGLTASVVRDSRGEFFLEGGAMVRADGGVVCIDEFDKMRPEDRVAIHEAMEQQTISVAKAGITTILNSRAAVLAAANPVHGRYDDMKSAAENIDFLPTILSRFDLIFIVRDERDEARDLAIARHVMSVHINAEVTEEGDVGEGIPLKVMKRFISYCRNKCAPRLNSDAVATLSNMYVQIREDSRSRSSASSDSVIPITVRQLEALIRISESLAKVSLAPDVGPHHVEEAMRLFRVSTLHAATSGLVEGGNAEDLVVIRNIERLIENQMSIGSSFETGELIQRIQSRANCTEDQVRHAVFIMVKRGQLRVINEGRRIRRMLQQTVTSLSEECIADYFLVL